MERKNEATEEQVILYEVPKEGKDLLFLWKPGDNFVIDHVERAEGQGTGHFRAVAEFWLRTKDRKSLLPEKDFIVDKLYTTEARRRTILQISISDDANGRLRRIGCQEVAIYHGNTDEVEVVNDPGTTARIYLGLSDDWRYGEDPLPSQKTTSRAVKPQPGERRDDVPWREPYKER